MRFTHILHILICVVNLFCSILGGKKLSKLMSFTTKMKETTRIVN